MRTQASQMLQVAKATPKRCVGDRQIAGLGRGVVKACVLDLELGIQETYILLKLCSGLDRHNKITVCVCVCARVCVSQRLRYKNLWYYRAGRRRRCCRAGS